MYRTKEDQIKLCGGILASGKCANGNANLPGTSMHEAGLAFDISYKNISVSEYAKLKEIAVKHNFLVSNTSSGVYGNRECWHFDYTGFKSKFWYGDPKITNAIKAAHGECSS